MTNYFLFSSNRKIKWVTFDQNKINKYQYQKVTSLFLTPSCLTIVLSLIPSVVIFPNFKRKFFNNTNVWASGKILLSTPLIVLKMKICLKTSLKRFSKPAKNASDLQIVGFSKCLLMQSGSSCYKIKATTKMILSKKSESSLPKRTLWKTVPVPRAYLLRESKWWMIMSNFAESRSPLLTVCGKMIPWWLLLSSGRLFWQNLVLKTLSLLILPKILMWGCFNFWLIFLKSILAFTTQVSMNSKMSFTNAKRENQTSN